MEITTEKQNKEKRMKRIEDSLRNLCDNIKHTNIQIIGVPEEKGKKKGSEKIEEITVKILPNMEKKTADQIQEAESSQNRINPKRNMPRHILINLTKIKGHTDPLSKSGWSKLILNHGSLVLDGALWPLHPGDGGAGAGLQAWAGRCGRW